jgi:Rab family protein
MTSGNSLKLVLLGDAQVGKTSLLQHFITGSFPTTFHPTIGVAFQSAMVTVDGIDRELLIWDTAGQELYRGLAPMYYRSAGVAIVVFDITERHTFDSVTFWIDELRSNAEEQIVVIVCGNKTDAEESRTVPFTEARDFSLRAGTIYVEASAKSGAGVELLFQTAVSTYVKLLPASKQSDTQPLPPVSEPSRGWRCF